MWFEDDVFRLIYLPWLLIPLLFALFSSNLTIFSIIPEIIGWSFFVVGTNLFNDYVDMDRKLKLGRNSLLILAFICFLSGFFVLINYIFYVISFLILFFIYSFKLKGIVFVDIILLITMALIPYFSLVENIDFNILFVLLMLAVISMLIDKTSDEKKYKNKIKECNILLLISIFIFILSIIFIIVKNIFYLFFIPLPILFIFALIGLIKKYPFKLTLSYKIVGVYALASSTFYFIAILVQMGKLI